jgi:uncharacterized repeat protein (TIGR02543 family)
MSAWYNKTMAFPGELNINYYKGDTHEFKVYPQKTDGSIFYLNDYISPTFKIAEARGQAGVDAGQITGSAKISNDGTHIVCAITPENGALMSSDTTYVYDIQVYSQGYNTYDKIFTLLTGSISVTDDVTQGTGTLNPSTASYKVFYYSNDATSGSAPIDTNEYSLNQSVIVKNSGTMERVGYTFIAWTKSSAGTGNLYLPGDTHPIVSSDLKFYPKWDALTYAVNFNSEGGSSVASTSYYTDQPISAPTSPTKSGSTFVGWCETPEAIETVSFPYTPGGIGDISLYAKWVEA